jgi:hypothetical protein
MHPDLPGWGWSWLMPRTVPRERRPKAVRNISEFTADFADGADM